MNSAQDEVNKVPDDKMFNLEHLWMEQSEDGSIRCGVTGYFCEKAGDIISAEFIRNIRNMQVETGDDLLSLETLKGSFSVKAPLPGTVLAINDLIADMPETINTSPYDEGWLFTVVIDDYFDFEHQMHPDDYESYILKEKESESF